jgi:CHASE3 domain sensor protein
MIITRKLGASLVVLALVVVVLGAVQVWQTSRIAATVAAEHQAEADARRSEVNAIQKEFGQAKAPSHPL